jgi:putative lipoprotein
MRASSTARGCIALILLLCAAGCPDRAPDATATLEGEAFYRERIAAPPGARLEVLLEDVSRADAPARQLASFVREDAGQPPYPFAVPYARERIVEGARYVLRARLLHGETLLFTTDRALPVITGGAPTTGLRLLLRSAPARRAGAPAAALPNTYWKLLWLGDRAVEVFQNQPEPHLVFRSEEGRLGGADGCNRIVGSWRMDGDRLVLGPLAATLMACAEGEAQARRFAATLEDVERHRIAGDRLELLDGRGAVLARFEAVALP